MLVWTDGVKMSVVLGIQFCYCCAMKTLMDLWAQPAEQWDSEPVGPNYYQGVAIWYGYPSIWSVYYVLNEYSQLKPKYRSKSISFVALQHWRSWNTQVLIVNVLELRPWLLRVHPQRTWYSSWFSKDRHLFSCIHPVKYLSISELCSKMLLWHAVQLGSLIRMTCYIINAFTLLISNHLVP